MDYRARALELVDELRQDRRYLHFNAEVGLELPKACAYVTERLTELGLDPKPCGHGVTATVGSGEPCIMLRADMDALPMPDQSGEDFACPTGTEGHCCGHDLHAAMLLSAARMLKENEAALRGTVKLMFQPAEETFEGAHDMIGAGILENPKVDAAVAVHVTAGPAMPGSYTYNDSGTMMNSADGFQVTVRGKGAHGAYPDLAIDPINIAAHVHIALQEIIAREVNPRHTCVMTVGQFNAGTAPNIIPEFAVMRGSIRCDDAQTRAQMVRRMREVAQLTAQAFGGTAEIEMLYQIPPLVCNPDHARECLGYLEELAVPGLTGQAGITSNASEDFAVVCENVPSLFFYLDAGFGEDVPFFPAHNPRVRFNEDVMPVGAAFLAHAATRWLETRA